MFVRLSADFIHSITFALAFIATTAALAKSAEGQEGEPSAVFNELRAMVSFVGPLDSFAPNVSFRTTRDYRAFLVRDKLEIEGCVVFLQSDWVGKPRQGTEMVHSNISIIDLSNIDPERSSSKRVVVLKMNPGQLLYAGEILTEDGWRGGWDNFLHLDFVKSFGPAGVDLYNDELTSSIERKNTLIWDLGMRRKGEHSEPERREEIIQKFWELVKVCQNH